MHNSKLRQRQRIDPTVPRQFIESVAWWEDDASDAPASPERTRANDLARRAQEQRANRSLLVAISLYEQALELFRLHGAPAEITRCLVDFASCLHRRRESVAMLTQARNLYEEALTRLRTTGNDLETADCLLNLAKCNEDWATDATNTSRNPSPADGAAAPATYDVAITYYDYALMQYRNCQAAPEDIAACLIGRGNALHTMFRAKPKLRPDLKGSLRDLEQAYSILVSVNSEPILIAESLTNLANSQNTDGLPDAFPNQLLALELLTTAGAPARDRLRSANQVLALWRQKSGELSQAQLYADAAVELGELLVTGALSREHKTEMRAQYASSLQKSIEIALARNPPDNEAAFAFAQRLKGRIVTEQMELRWKRQMP